jgi:hypothetical protein
MVYTLGILSLCKEHLKSDLHTAIKVTFHLLLIFVCLSENCIVNIFLLSFVSHTFTAFPKMLFSCIYHPFEQSIQKKQKKVTLYLLNL